MTIAFMGAFLLFLRGLSTPAVNSKTFVWSGSRGLKAEYIALSHCWGGKISPLLTTETLEPFQNRLSYAALPANFRDAIVITRELGIRYLWIDSLCILQDSKQDWQQESKMMAAIYRDSTLTISAMASSGSTQGILWLGTETRDGASFCDPGAFARQPRRKEINSAKT